MADELPPIIQQLVGDAGDLFTTLDEVEARLETFAGQDFTANLELNATTIAPTVAAAEADAGAFANQDYEAKLGVDTSKFLADMASAQTAMKLTQRDAITVGTDIGAAFAAINDAAESLATHFLSDQAAMQTSMKMTARDAIGMGTDIAAAFAATETAADVLKTNFLSDMAEMQTAMKLSQRDAIQLGTDIGAAFAAAGVAQDTGGGLGGIGGTGIAAGMAGWLANTFLVIHAIHLFMPEILGLVDSLAAATLGFTALGIAAAGTVSEISQGVSAVGSATDAIGKAIPGTTQWTSAVAKLGQQWSQIPTDVQPAVSAINNLIQNMANSPLGNQVRSWLNAQAITLTDMFAGLGNAFMPLIVAMERAVDTVEQIIQQMIGGGGLQRFVDALANMVGPAILMLAQLGYALARIGAGFAQAIQAGEGMQALVNLFRSIADLVNSSFGQGFIQGWVDFDRIITDLLGMGLRLVGWISNLSGGMKDLAVAIGFVVSGFAALKAVTWLSAWLASLSGAAGPVTDALYAMSTGLGTLLSRLIGPGALVVGITGLASELSRLTGIANPIASLWHGLASAIGLVSDAGNGANSTLLKYQGALHGAVYGTQALTDAQDLLVRSEQSIGGNLATLVDGFRMWNLQAATLTNTTGTAALRIAAATNTNDAFAQSINKVTDSVSNLITQLTDKNASLAQWAADAQILIQRGMDPSAVASLAQQAPQDLGSMVNATTDQLKQMNVQWQEQMLLAKMSGQHGVMDFVSALRDGFTNGTPVVHQAAAELFKQLGSTLNIPFTGTQQSIDQIASALQSIPINVLQNLAGATHQITAASQDAAKATQHMATAHQSLAQEALSVAANVALLGMGMRSTIGLLGEMRAAFFASTASMIDFSAAADAAAVGEDAVAASAAAMDVALDANPIGLIALAIAALGAAIYELVKHFGAVSHFLNGPWGTAISAAVAAIDPLLGAAMLIIGHWRGVETALKDIGNWFSQSLPHAFHDFINFFVNSVPHAFDNVIHFFSELPTKILDAIKDLPHLLNTAAQHAIAYFILGFIYEGIGIWDFFTKVIPRVLSILGNAASALFNKGVDLLKGMWDGIESFFTGPFVNFWTTLLPHIILWVGNTEIWLFQKGIGLLKGMWDGITEFFSGPFVAFWVALPSRVLGWVSGAGTWLFDTGMRLLRGMWNGIVNFFGGDFTSFFTNLPSRILSYFTGANNWLFDIGRKIITGLWDGLKSAFESVKSWLGGIGDIIKNLKGPPEKDAQILVENGMLVMQGFARGLQQGWGTHVTPTLANLTAQLHGGIGVGNVGLVGGGIAPIIANGAGGAQTTILNVTNPIQINGQTLAQVVTQYQLRQARGTGNVFSRFAGGSQTGAATSINPNAIQR